MTAPIQIRKPEAVRLIRSVAARRGQSITDAMADLAQAELERQDRVKEAEIERKLARVREIVERFNALPKTGEDLTDDDLYGPDGLPR